MTSRVLTMASPLKATLAFCIPLGVASITFADEPTSQVRRINPRTREFQPVAPADVVPGKIYSHYSERHGRYVWAFATEGGNFSYALGPGTTESPRNFDLPISTEQTEELLQEALGDWADAFGRMESEIMVRLGADDEWDVLRSPSSRSHYDLDNRRRWEWHGSRKVRVVHTNGNTWRYQDDWYVPAYPWISAACGCAH